MHPYPLLLEPILKHRVWGGNELARFGKSFGKGETIGESWEVSDLPESIEDGRNRIENGELSGMTLREAIAEHQPMIMGAAEITEEGGFPLLIKYLDARRNLSVQVHPTAEYVKSHPDAYMKSEAWVVVDAKPGSVIYKGVKPGVTAEQLARHIRDDTVIDDLIAVPVEPGDCYYLPSGTCHALGEGIIVAEVQTPSDTTFRVYDWGRSGRELHIEQALQCIEFSSEPIEPDGSAVPIDACGMRTTPLAETEFFTIERVEALAAVSLPVVTDDMPIIWMIITGQGTLTGGGIECELRPGVTILTPAAMDDGEATLQAGCALLRVALPSPIRNLIA